MGVINSIPTELKHDWPQISELELKLEGVEDNCLLERGGKRGSWTAGAVDPRP
jgi:hypothetical protein